MKTKKFSRLRRVAVDIRVAYTLSISLLPKCSVCAQLCPTLRPHGL